MYIICLSQQIRCIGIQMSIESRKCRLVCSIECLVTPLQTTFPNLSFGKGEQKTERATRSYQFDLKKRTVLFFPLQISPTLPSWVKYTANIVLSSDLLHWCGVVRSVTRDGQRTGQASFLTHDPSVTRSNSPGSCSLCLLFPLPATSLELSLDASHKGVQVLQTHP